MYPSEVTVRAPVCSPQHPRVSRACSGVWGPPSISDPCRMSLRPKLAGIQAGTGREARRLGKRLHSSGAHGHSVDSGSCTWCPPHLETPSCQLPAPSPQPPGWACPEGTFPNRFISLCPQKQAPSCTPGVGVKDPHFPLSARQGLGAAQRLGELSAHEKPQQGPPPPIKAQVLGWNSTSQLQFPKCVLPGPWGKPSQAPVREPSHLGQHRGTHASPGVGLTLEFE